MGDFGVWLWIIMRRLNVENLTFSEIWMMRRYNHCSKTRVVNGNRGCGRSVQPMKRHAISPDRSSPFDHNNAATSNLWQPGQWFTRRDRVIDANGVEDDGTQWGGRVHGTNSNLVNGP